ncbi:NAD+ synthetase [Lachnospiraceae bacterium 2_1_46FAA]|nr:NAD+ synthetase [Lachnospiraceae bacterium 2_1_46FAA]
MKQGFVKVAAATPDIRVADISYNTEQICKLIDETVANGAKIVVFPELCVTGYTCGDLFFQDILLERSKEALNEIAEYTKDKDALVFVGVPLAINGKLYNVAAALNRGKIIGLVTKTFLPNYSEFYEMRTFQAGPEEARVILYEGEQVAFGPQILFKAKNMEELIVSAEICEDVWSPIPPSIMAATAGATILVNCSASSETYGKDGYRTSLISGQSARMIAGYVYANAGAGESTTDLVFGGHNIIAENGMVLKESRRYMNDVIYSEIDVHRLLNERRKNTTFQQMSGKHFLVTVPFEIEKEETELTRSISQMPFIPEDEKERDECCEEILMIQALGLKKRLQHTNCRNVVIGVSGGLDSTLALLVAVKTFDMLGIDRKNITAVTMPCFGTTDRTYQNACVLIEKLGVTLREISIQEAVRNHFKDIGQREDLFDTTYENAQARERTQVLMDIANMENGMVIGTGDMSELALGWATYNGDHMSMYGVNSSIPKTFVRFIVKHCAVECEDETLKKALFDILDTPISPELLPAKEGEIEQKTEDLVGPYELHDFYLYYMLRYGYEPSKIYRLARKAFAGVYEDETILKWLKSFCRRFFTQQFKRSCLPDGPKVGTVGLSPRGDLRMPSDACVTIWLEELERL